MSAKWKNLLYRIKMTIHGESVVIHSTESLGLPRERIEASRKLSLKMLTRGPGDLTGGIEIRVFR